MDYSEFMSAALAEPLGDGLWNVYANGIMKISDCSGETEFEAKEDAWRYIQRLKDKIDEG